VKEQENLYITTSHSLTTNNLTKFPNLAGCADMVDIIIEAVKKSDLTHYNSLVEVVKDSQLNNITREKNNGNHS